MNKKVIITLHLLASALWAGGTEKAALSTSEPDAFKWITPTLDARLRYEFREQDGRDESNALTARARLGLLLGENNGFSAFGEIEGTYAALDDYNAGGGADPVEIGNTGIADPENFELNRAWAQWKGQGLTLKGGRQRIIRNNAAFIGNVGWRQNEQTYDAISAGFTGDNFSLFYAYADRVQRIFGDDAIGAAKEFDGEFHFLDGTYTVNDDLTLGAYLYLVDVENNPNVGESNTFGGFVSYGPFTLEAAFQDGTTAVGGQGDYDSWYAHARVAKKFGEATYGAGVEYLEKDFKTPLATVHAFNGFADAFIGQRLGLNNAGGAYDGLTDLYLSITRPGLPWGITFKGFAHLFLDDSFDETYGYEFDAVLVKKVTENLTAVVKAAWFIAEDGNGYSDIKQITVGANFKY